MFLDESCDKTNMTPLYGRLRGGKRLYDSAPAGHWNTTTLISSIRLDGSTAMMVLDGAADAEAFLAYIQEVLIPDLQPGDIVVMDNLATHKVSGVAESLEAAGAEVCGICRPTALTSIPLKRCGPKSKPICGASRQEHKRLSGRPSVRLSRQFHPRMPRVGLALVVMVSLIVNLL